MTLKYSPGDRLQNWMGVCQVVGYIRYSGCWYYVLLYNGADTTTDYSQGEVEHPKYFNKIGEAE